jgi:hypothetical protein
MDKTILKKPMKLNDRDCIVFFSKERNLTAVGRQYGNRLCHIVRFNDILVGRMDLSGNKNNRKRQTAS